MTHKGEGPSLIPTECPKFVAACATVGIRLQDGLPGISNVYSKGQTYELGEPGHISFYLSDGQGINPLALAKVWLSPESELQEAAALPQRLLARHDADSWAKLADDIETLHVTAAIASIREFSRNRFPVDSKIAGEQERQSAEVVAWLADSMRQDQRRNGGAVAAKIAEHWNRAMLAWVKAWIANYLELRDAWKSARPSIKIEREGKLPLIIPKGKDFARLLKRWV
jgi:hypothetical protein